MTSIVIEDRASGTKSIYQPKYPSQRSFFEENRNERIANALKEIEHMGNVNIYLWKKSKLRLIAVRGN